MKNVFFLLTFISVAIFLTNCNKDEDEDFTNEIVGTFMGAFGSNSVGNISPYEVVVTKINNNTINIKPKTGTEFSEFEIELEKFSNATISSPNDNNQQLDKSVIFTIGIPVILTMQIDPTGDAKTFTGEKQ